MTYLQQAPPGLEHEKQTFQFWPFPNCYWFLQVRNILSHAVEVTDLSARVMVQWLKQSVFDT